MPQIEETQQNVPTIGTQEQPPTPSRPSSYSFDAASLRQRNAPLREAVGSSTMSATASTASPSESDRDDEGNEFECNICLEMASNPIVTLCGHLFCWPCLHRWMQSRSPSANACPVCKAKVERSKLVPIYARGRQSKDPREEVIPERPTAQRPEAAPSQANRGWDNFFFPGGTIPTGNGITVGFGLFPSLFGLHYTFGVPAHLGSRDRQAQVAQQQAFLSRICMMVGILVMIAILLY
ncbi:uncharacterized protein SPPG_06996 [Spizellomyces punctatus DAOM BR117]|uniref:RING-type E3 ubiquitin transferase n=1 Tax=Spizellomyces punctatus (strain DAOM BR117) TaxID=645134 RepID=A0A0L0H7K3_SPIPD|nr:uncharacterized protein SPPG_06996 [Spizellomyces punctatus DAOM BR117]KNC97520.1 hypothetical protein SPPG_06996 [Spizellomyces punctatus DAOM BR117]|eukprot:XP_016605560.1 hypothetical protein SPPG_06996 [Spizellomyces punctatus DAOM BR117]